MTTSRPLFLWNESKRLTGVMTTVPENFKLHPLLQKVIADRRLMMQEEMRVRLGAGRASGFCHTADGRLLRSHFR